MVAAVMAEQEYFKSALSDFTYEAASGGAIRHLADLGYTVKQISGQLSFPTPFARVQKTVWQRLLDTGVLLMEEPGSGQGLNRGKAGYAMERDKYGRTSFRLVAPKEGGTKAGGEKDNVICWKERRFGDSGNVAASGQKRQFIGRKDRDDRTDSRQKRTLSTSGKAGVTDGERGRRLAVYLADKCRENGGEAYISCRFGELCSRDRAAYEKMLAVLNERQQEYVSGLPWAGAVCYHRLDQRMQEIAVRLYNAGMLQETCYFMQTEERVVLF